ncbi:MAG: NADH-quinone oxidoreductase subunit N [Verrucomicrobiota bacterium]
MNATLLSLEIIVVTLALALLLVDLWIAPAYRRWLGYVGAAVLFMVWAFTFTMDTSAPEHAFGTAYVMDDFALFFKRLFLLAGAVVLIMSVEFSDQIQTGITEFYALVLLALSGMMFAASANSFVMLFVSLELITITFYVLTGFLRSRVQSLEASVKYLILGALASAFMVFGIAMVFGTTGTLDFGELSVKLTSKTPLAQPILFNLGMLLILAGLGFKIAVFPFQFWVPDVYQGAPTPVTAFLAIGSKAAGFALLVRLLYGVIPKFACSWLHLLIGLSALTILYGNLCALPQRNLKRLLAYSGIAHAGYLLMGFSTLNQAGNQAGIVAMLFYLQAYLFTVLAAFAVITIVLRQLESEDIGGLAGLHQRSPFLAATMTLAMISLAGIPPLAGFFGKFLLIKAVLQQGATNSAFYWLAGIAVAGVVMSFWYYFGVIRAIYWAKDATDLSPVEISFPMRMALVVCIIGMLYLGLMPNLPLGLAEQGTAGLR